MTDEERREVAARLRWIDAKDDPMNSALMLDKIRRAIDDHMDAPSAFPPYEWWVTRAHVTFNRLADLIEPEERTCYVEHIDDDSFHLSCGHEAAGHVSPSFCPSCGAKVIQE